MSDREGAKILRLVALALAMAPMSCAPAPVTPPSSAIECSSQPGARMPGSDVCGAWKPPRPSAERLCKETDGAVSWISMGSETEEEVMARYWDTMAWREMEQRMEP